MPLWQNKKVRFTILPVTKPVTQVIGFVDVAAQGGLDLGSGPSPERRRKMPKIGKGLWDLFCIPMAFLEEFVVPPFWKVLRFLGAIIVAIPLFLLTCFAGSEEVAKFLPRLRNWIAHNQYEVYVPVD